MAGGKCMAREKDKIKEVKTYVYPNAIVRLHIPDLTDEERERRMNEFKQATETFLKGVIRERMEKERKAAQDETA
jgi:hypothetical protein